MPVHIDHVVTEVFTEADPDVESTAVDKRWQEQMKLEAMLKRTTRQARRLQAEGFDD